VAVFYDDSIYGVPHALVQLVRSDANCLWYRPRLVSYCARSRCCGRRLSRSAIQCWWPCAGMLIQRTVLPNLIDCCHGHPLLQVTRLPVLPELCVFLTNRFLPFPVILQQVRLVLHDL
jgi:hypothetical protein